MKCLPAITGSTPSSRRRFGRRLATAALALLVLPVLSACGGGGDGDQGATPAPASPTLTAPPVGRVSDYQVTDTDNSNNQINWLLEFKILSSSADGSYSESVIGNENVTVNGTYYGPVDQVIDFDAQHATLRYTLEQSPAVVCTYDTPLALLPVNHADGTVLPARTASIACSNGDAIVEQFAAGSVVDTESITVPAGTFTAHKASYRVVLSNSTNSVVTTEDFTVWSDTATGRQLQLTIDYSYNTAVSTGDRIHQLRQLQFLS